MRQQINFVQTMNVDCVSCHKTEMSARIGYDETPDAYSIMCARGLDRCYYMVMNRKQHEAYANKLNQLRNIMKE